MSNNAIELNLDELENVIGGNGGSPTVLPAKKGFRVYKIQSGDNLTRIAKKYNTTVNYLFENNDTITDKNFIRTGFYMYVPEN